MLVVRVLLCGRTGMRSQISRAPTAELPGMLCWLARGRGCRCLYSRLYYQFPPLYSYWLRHLDADLVLV